MVGFSARMAARSAAAGPLRQSGAPAGAPPSVRKIIGRRAKLSARRKSRARGPPARRARRCPPSRCRPERCGGRSKRAYPPPPPTGPPPAGGRSRSRSGNRRREARFRKVRLVEVGDALLQRGKLGVRLPEGARREAGAERFQLLDRTEDGQLVFLLLRAFEPPDVRTTDEPVLPNKRRLVRPGAADRKKPCERHTQRRAGAPAKCTHPVHLRVFYPYDAREARFARRRKNFAARSPPRERTALRRGATFAPPSAAAPRTRRAPSRCPPRSNAPPPRCPKGSGRPSRRCAAGRRRPRARTRRG